MYIKKRRRRKRPLAERACVAFLVKPSGTSLVSLPVAAGSRVWPSRGHPANVSMLLCGVFRTLCRNPFPDLPSPSF